MPDKCKKNISAFKKISKSPEELCDFFRLAAGDQGKYCVDRIALRKNGPSLEEPLGFMMKIFFSGTFGNNFMNIEVYGTIFLMENPARPACPPVALRLSCAST
jgi:hypothetical protein